MAGSISELESSCQRLVTEFDVELLETCRRLRVELNGVIGDMKGVMEKTLRRKKSLR